MPRYLIVSIETERFEGGGVIPAKIPFTEEDPDNIVIFGIFKINQ